MLDVMLVDLTEKPQACAQRTLLFNEIGIHFTQVAFR